MKTNPHLHQVSARSSRALQLPRLPTQSVELPGPIHPRERGADAACESSPQEVWWRLEDLWLRLAALGLLCIERGDAGINVILRNLRHAHAGVGVDGAGELRAIALDAETYQSRQDGRIRSFVRTLEYRSADLVCELSTTTAIARWPDGEGLALQVRGFMARLAAMQCQAGSGGPRP
jgi:hypothetical protein